MDKVADKSGDVTKDVVNDTGKALDKAGKATKDVVNDAKKDGKDAIKDIKKAF